MAITFSENTKFYRPLHEQNTSTVLESIRSKVTGTSSTKKVTPHTYYSLRETRKKLSNLAKVQSLEKLEENWNHNDASPFHPKLIETCLDLVNAIVRQPDVFPTARDSIQFEYEKENGEYLEFEIFEDGMTMLQVDEHDTETEKSFSTIDINQMNQIISEFYGREI